MADLGDLERDTVVRGLVEQAVTLRRVDTLSETLVLVYYEGAGGTIERDFIDERLAETLTIKPAEFSFPFRFYPAGVPRLFSSVTDLVEPLRRARKRHVLHSVIEAYIGSLSSRLSSPLVTVAEIHAVAGARNDSLSVAPDREILWEVFGTASRVEEDLRKLERDEEPRRLKVAVVLDNEIDSALFQRFTRAVQGSSVRTWLQVSDLMVADRLDATARRIDQALDALMRTDSPDQLQLVEFDLYGEHRQWHRVPEIPFAYSGLGGDEFHEHLEDPVFLVDVQNIGTREARIHAAFINVRFRQIDPHGIASENVLKPACTIVLPLNEGQEGYREVKLQDPVLVPAGKHVRLLVRLDEAGFTWKGEVDIGFRYGMNRVLHVPAVSIFR